MDVSDREQAVSTAMTASQCLQTRAARREVGDAAAGDAAADAEDWELLDEALEFLREDAAREEKAA